jgi:hypothetical protein
VQGDTSRKHIPAPAHRLPGQLVECGWCGASVPVPSRGRVPKWCSATCRNRGWQATHASSKGPVRVVQQRVQVPVPMIEPRNIEGWVQLLDVLAKLRREGRSIPVTPTVLTRGNTRNFLALPNICTPRCAVKVGGIVLTLSFNGP